MDGRAVVAFRIKAVEVQAGYALTDWADVQAVPVPDASGACPSVTPADALSAADPGAVFPVYGSIPPRDGAIVDGWLTFRARTSAPACILTVRLFVAYQPRGPSPSASPSGAVVATVQALGDGSAIRPSQRTIGVAASSLPLDIASNVAILPELVKLDAVWHATSLPVLAPLPVSGVDGASEWARRTQVARDRLATIYASMRKLTDGLPANGTEDFGDLVAMYGRKLGALTDLAHAAKRRDGFAAATATGEVRLATDEAQRLLRRLMDAYAPYLSSSQLRTLGALGL